MNTAKFFRISGLLLIVAAQIITGYNFHEDHAAATASQQIINEIAPDMPPEAAEIAPSPPAEITPNPAPQTITLTDDYIGILTIPALDISLPVQKNFSDSRLKSAPCLYFGSPGEENMVIAAHNYRAHFGNLHKLAIGDVVELTTEEGTLSYTVAQQEIIADTARDQLLASDYPLSLFTCTRLGGERLVVRLQSAEGA